MHKIYLSTMMKVSQLIQILKKSSDRIHCSLHSNGKKCFWQTSEFVYILAQLMILHVEEERLGENHQDCKNLWRLTSLNCVQTQLSQESLVARDTR